MVLTFFSKFTFCYDYSINCNDWYVCVCSLILLSHHDADYYKKCDRLRLSIISNLSSSIDNRDAMRLHRNCSSFA